MSILRSITSYPAGIAQKATANPCIRHCQYIYPDTMDPTLPGPKMMCPLLTARLDKWHRKKLLIVRVRKSFRRKVVTSSLYYRKSNYIAAYVCIRQFSMGYESYLKFYFIFLCNEGNKMLWGTLESYIISYIIL